MIGEPRHTSLHRVVRLLAFLATAVFVALSLTPKSSTRFYAWPWYFYWQVLLSAPIAILGGRLLFGRAALPRFGGWIDAGLALGLGSTVVAAALSPFPQPSLIAALGPIAATTLAYLVLAWLEQEHAPCADRRSRLANLLGGLLACGVASSFSLLLITDVLPLWNAGHGLRAALVSSRNAHPFGHSTYTAGFAVLATPWLLGLAVTTDGKRRWGWLAFALAASALIPTTASRGGVLGLAVVVGCGAVFWLRDSRLGRTQRGLLVAGALLFAGVLVGLDPRLRALVLERHWSDAANESNRQRAAMLEAGWRMGRDRPFTGYGPGTVSLIYPHYRADLSGGVENVLQLHSTPAQVWAELGAPGILAVILILGGLVRLARHGLRALETASSTPLPSRRSERIRAQALTAALGGYLVFTLTDYQLDIPWFAATIALYLALLRAYASGSDSGRTVVAFPFAGQRPLGLALLAAFGAILWPTVFDLRARQRFDAGATAREAGNDAEFLANVEKAAATAPWDSFYPVQLAAFYGEQWLQATDPLRAMQAQTQCRRWLQEALARNPDQEYAHFNLGWLLLNTDPVEAERHFLAAANLVPDKGGVYLGLGLSRLARHDLPKAVRALALEWLNDPLALASPLWEKPPLSGLQTAVGAELQQIGHRWQAQASLSVETRNQLRYVTALNAWWRDPPGDTAALAQAGSAEQRRFFVNLAAIEQRIYAPPSGSNEPWEQLYLLWRSKPSQTPTDPTDPEFAAALERRLARERTSFADLLTAPLGDEKDLIQYTRRNRLAAGILQRHPDGFPLNDWYIFPENRLLSKYASFLFPAKGYLPGRLLLDRVNEPASTPR